MKSVYSAEALRCVTTEFGILLIKALYEVIQNKIMVSAEFLRVSAISLERTSEDKRTLQSQMAYK